MSEEEKNTAADAATDATTDGTTDAPTDATATSSTAVEHNQVALVEPSVAAASNGQADTDGSDHEEEAEVDEAEIGKIVIKDSEVRYFIYQTDIVVKIYECFRLYFFFNTFFLL